MMSSPTTLRGCRARTRCRADHPEDGCAGLRQGRWWGGKGGGTCTSPSSGVTGPPSRGLGGPSDKGDGGGGGRDLYYPYSGYRTVLLGGWGAGFWFLELIL